MSFNHGYLNNASIPTSSNGKRRWNDGEAVGTPPANSGNENNNTTAGNGSPWQAFKRLRVTHEDEDGDFFMNSPGRLFPPPAAAMHHSPPPQQQHHQAQPDWAKHQTAGQETGSEHATTTPVTHNPVQDSPDADYQYVNHALGQLHQERMERERRQAALQNQHYQDAAHHHHTSTRSPAVGRERSDNGSGKFHTPPTSRRKVVHLHTNSKLG
jgi:hypothetical protein